MAEFINFEDDEPYAKRMKADWKVSCVSWADEGDREDEYKGLERDYRKCMYCDESFGSRNALYKHVNAAHKKPPNSRRSLQTIRRGPTGSVADRLAHTEETAGATSRTQDPLRGAHVETQVRKEQKKEEYDLCEVFSVPRIAPEATKMQLRGGWSLDWKQTCRITGKRWDCLKAEDREWARRLVRRDKPLMLILSPPCTLFSQLQQLSPYGLPETRCPEKWKEALVMLQFAVELCEIQRAAGRGFLFEHPLTASSWLQPVLKALAEKRDVITTVIDMCRYGMTATDKIGTGPARKSTKFLTNVPEVADSLNLRCEGGA